MYFVRYLRYTTDSIRGVAVFLAKNKLRRCTFSFFSELISGSNCLNDPDPDFHLIYPNRPIKTAMPKDATTAIAILFESVVSDSDDLPGALTEVTFL